MENEIQVGEYVRTKDGQIYKIEDGTEFYEDSVNVGLGIIPDVDGIWVDKEHFTYVDKREIVKHSPNLKDIIQKDDFVNKCRVYEVEEKGITVYQTVENSATDYNWISFDEIEEIVTKEMMESISYKVERKD